MQDGRPGEGSFGSYFFIKGTTEHVNSLIEESNVSRCNSYSGQLSINAKAHGKGKIWLSNARTFIGQWEMDTMKTGQLSELQKYGTLTVSQVSYDAQKDRENETCVNDQTPISKQELSQGKKFQKIEEQGKKRRW
jgi:hypothetical protein